MKFVHFAIIESCKKKKRYILLFLNINKFCTHPQIIFLKGTSDENYKKKFINTCDAMLYGRSLGESFGLACAEFAIKCKDIISYKFNRHRVSQIQFTQKKLSRIQLIQTLYNLLLNFKKKSQKKYNSKYLKYTKVKVMKDFKNIFLKKNKIKFSHYDYLINYVSLLKMNYLYIRHKIYNHYFDYFFSKFFIK